MQNVDVLRGSTRIAEIVPFVGVPDALAIYQHETDKKHEPTIVGYNGLGADDERAKHLRRLNGKVGVPVRPIDEIAEYIGGIV